MASKMVQKEWRISGLALFIVLLTQTRVVSAQGNIDIQGSSVAVNAVNNAFITANNLNLQGGNSLILDSSTMQIGGTIVSAGSFDASKGTIEMNSTAAQTIPAHTFVNNALWNLIINNTNSGGVSLGGALDIYNSLNFTGTGKKLTTNGKLTFKSTASNTAWLGDMTGNTITR